jgi:endonuclease III
MATMLDTLARLRLAHPDAHCELDHESTFQLLCATVMSAQTTDVAVNKVTPELFRRFPTAKLMAAAEPLELEDLINRIGMFRQKAKNLVALAKLLVMHHAGKVPASLDALVALPGVGRKTANVVLGVAFGIPEGVVVDTHVSRLSQRLGWTKEILPGPIEHELATKLPREVWDIVSHTLIFHGRRVCFARKPDCTNCPINDACPSAFDAEFVGRKATKRSPSSKRAAATSSARDSKNVPTAKKIVSSKRTSVTSSKAATKSTKPARKNARVKPARKKN